MPSPLKTTSGKREPASLGECSSEHLPLAQSKLTPCGRFGSCALEKVPRALLPPDVQAPEPLGLVLTCGLYYLHAAQTCLRELLCFRVASLSREESREELLFGLNHDQLTADMAENPLGPGHLESL